MPRTLALTACMLVVALGGRVGAEEPPPRVAVLEWASGPPSAYDERVVSVAFEGGSMANGSIPFGPDTSLRYGSAGGGVSSLLLDRDFDGTLLDEQPVDFEVELPAVNDLLAGSPPDVVEQATVRVYPPWARETGLEDGVRVYLRLGSGKEVREFVIVPLLHLEGHVVAGGRRRLVSVHDGNHDLCFDDPAEDPMFLDVDGDGVICRHATSHERMFGGHALRVREETLQVEVEDAGRRVVFRPSEDPPFEGCPWMPETLPRPGRVQEGEARPMEEIRAEYDEKRAEIKRRRGGAVLLTDLVVEAGRLGTHEAFDFLELAYRQNDSVALRRTVIEAMGDERYADHARVLLAIAGKVRESELRSACIRALHAMDAPGREDVLLKIAKAAKDDHVYREAVRYAAATGTDAAQSGLLVLLGRCGRDADRAYETYWAATRVLGNPPSEDLVKRALRTKSPRVQALAMLDARALPHPAARDHALACARKLPDDRPLRAAIVEVLGGTGDADSVRTLMDRARDLEPAERERAAALLREVRDREAVEVVLQALEAPCPASRALAAEVLPAIDPAALGPRLAERLRREPDATVQERLARAAGVAGVGEAVGALLEVLRRTDVAEPVAAACVEALLVVGWEDAAAVAWLQQVMRSGDDAMRLRIVDGAAARRSRKALPILAQGLLDARWQVRLAAAQGLGDLRAKGAVPVLIHGLEEEQRRRVRHAVADALFHTTGLYLSDAAEPWRAWWDAEGAAFRVPPEAPAPREVDPGRVYATFYGVPVVSDHCAFVLDQSGSMDGDPGGAGPGEAGGSPFERAVQETLKVAAALPDGAFLDVILFESSVHAWRKELVPLDAEARTRLKSFLDQQHPFGGANLHDALVQALELADVDTVYLLSDGEPTAGRHVRTDEILEAAGEVNRSRRVVVHCVALGSPSALLRRLAGDTGGTYIQR